MKTITRLLFAALMIAPLAHAVDCEQFNAGDKDHIRKLNLIVAGCSAVTTGASGSQTTIPRVAAGGTANAITATFSPAITLADKTIVAIINTAGANSSATPTFNPNALGALTITGRGGNALVAGDTGAAGAVLILEYNLANTRWELANPAKVRAPSDLVGNIPATNLGSGTGASSSTVLHGNMTWAAITAMTNPMTTGGDIIYGGSSGSPTRLAGAGTPGYILYHGGGTAAPYWAAPPSGGSGSLTACYVGFGSGADALTGEAEFCYNSSTNTLAVDKIVAGTASSIIVGTAGSAVGSVGFRNATSGTITLAPTTGALGTVTLTLPAATDTLVGRATTDTLTNKSIAYGQLTGLGTGVSTALGVNIGSAGAPVLFNGAGGTPSSITLTNGTSLPGSALTGAYTAAGMTMPTSRVLCRTTASTGAVEECSAGNGISLSSTTISKTTSAVAPAYSASITQSITGYDAINVGTLTGPLTLALSGGVDGQAVRIRLKQDGTGSRVLTLDSKFRLGADITAVTLSTAANKIDYLGVIYHASDDKYDVVAFVKGY